jgi:hypothetical protein
MLCPTLRTLELTIVGVNASQELKPLPTLITFIFVNWHLIPLSLYFTLALWSRAVFRNSPINFYEVKIIATPVGFLFPFSFEFKSFLKRKHSHKGNMSKTWTK